MRRFTVSLLISILIILSLASFLHAQELVTALKVVDGDTIQISYKGSKESIRLIGIDTPESSANKKAKKDAIRSGKDLTNIISMGKQAANYTNSLIKLGDKVNIEFDVQKRDKYGRLLGYVYLSNGKMLNDEIVKAGYANIMTYPPNIKHQDRFLKTYRNAKENKRGLWK